MMSEQNGLRPLDLSNLLKHAWRAGADGDEWVDYDPETCPAFARVTRALAAAPDAPAQAGDGWRVRKLEWKEVALDALWGGWQAQTPFGIYRVSEFKLGYHWWFGSDSRSADVFSTLDAAQAAVDADYEARIRAAIGPAPPASEAST